MHAGPFLPRLTFGMGRVLRLSPELYAAKQARAGRPVAVIQAKPAASPATGKYGNRKVDGYDSIKERDRAAALRLMQAAGQIRNLREQVRFALIPAQRDRAGRVLERACDYIADFAYETVGVARVVVEDVKGYKDGAAYALFVIKRKLMLLIHHVQVREL
jgi:hypothetical protein